MEEPLRTGAAAAATSAAAVPAPIVQELNEHTTVFYLGRGLTDPSPYGDIPGNWVDSGSWALGGCTYAVHRGGKAVVYDSMTTPDEGQWVRDYLVREHGITQFVLVLSHWHLDHIAGNASYRDGPIVALELTRDALIEHREAIESGTLWGPPALEVVLPNITFDGRLDIHLDDLAIEFHHFDIHSRDGNLMLIPADGALFAGDTLEDPLTFVIEPEGIPTHIAELARLKTLDFTRIFPNHGNLEVIRAGGYGRSFIDAIEEYDTNLLRRVGEPGFLDLPIEQFIPDALASGAVSMWEPYRGVHANNLKLVYDVWRGQ